LAQGRELTSHTRRRPTESGKTFESSGQTWRTLLQAKNGRMEVSTPQSNKQKSRKQSIVRSKAQGRGVCNEKENKAAAKARLPRKERERASKKNNGGIEGKKKGAYARTKKRRTGRQKVATNSQF